MAHVRLPKNELVQSALHSGRIFTTLERTYVRRGELRLGRKFSVGATGRGTRNLQRGNDKISMLIILITHNRRKGGRKEGNFYFTSDIMQYKTAIRLISDTKMKYIVFTK